MVLQLHLSVSMYTYYIYDPSLIFGFAVTHSQSVVLSYLTWSYIIEVQMIGHVYAIITIVHIIFTYHCEYDATVEIIENCVKIITYIGYGNQFTQSYIYCPHHIQISM